MFAFLFGIIARVIIGLAPLWIVILVLSFLSWVMFGGPERQATVQNFENTVSVIKSTAHDGNLDVVVKNTSSARIHTIRFVCDFLYEDGTRKRSNTTMSADYINPGDIKTVSVKTPLSGNPKTWCDINYETDRRDLFKNKTKYDITALGDVVVLDSSFKANPYYYRNETTSQLGDWTLKLKFINKSDIDIDAFKISCDIDAGDISGTLTKPQGERWWFGNEHFNTRSGEGFARNMYRTYELRIGKEVKANQSVIFTSAIHDLPLTTRTHEHMCKLVEMSKNGTSVDMERMLNK